VHAIVDSVGVLREVVFVFRTLAGRIGEMYMRSLAISVLVFALSRAIAIAAEPSVVYFRSDYGHGEGTARLPENPDPRVSQVWRCPLPMGHSTPCIYGHRVYVTSFDPAQQQLATTAIDASSGEIVWQQPAPRGDIEAFHEVSSPAVASPACDGERVYVFFGSYGLLAYDLAGALAWSRPMGPFQDEYGSASSPILVGDLVILNEDHDTNNALYAFDRRTGELLWQVDRNDFTRSYSTPIAVTVDGQQQVVVAGALTVTGYDAGTGQRRWWYHGLARIVNPTPAFDGQTLYVASWSPGGDEGERITMENWAMASEQYDANHDGQIRRDELTPGPVLTRFYRIDLNQDAGLDQREWKKQAEAFRRAENAVKALKIGGTGELPADRVQWSYAKGVPYVASPLYHEGVVFMVKDGGIFTSLSAQTGALLKQGRLPGRGNYYSSPLVADGKIFLASEQGVVTVVSAAGDWQILATRDFAESIYATPVVRDGRLYLRTSAALYCLASPHP
jgi:outer membrane protein assembly factor BamB